ncbi:MAG: fatty acid hydroxylase [SAR86 cluster bacterium]|uniref:Fatty acid hydroxylase n=1 Tax=SAR86 cluster bacterium TaxID=2030880 RepID=A0A2A4MP56_9GAMM|nr:MAG: fatty acid hydroxylase [SAR86 cluster bacterium]
MAYFIVAGQHSPNWLYALVLFFLCLSFIVEALLPYRAEFNKPQGDRLRDFLHGFVNEALVVVGIFLLPLVSSYLPVLWHWPISWPLWTQLILAIFIADIGITLTHFLSHKIQFLWRFHAVHHSVKRMYGFNGLMKHPLHQIIETAAGITPLLLMGTPPEVISLLGTAVVLQLLLQHSNVNYCSGVLKHVLAVNCVHRFHHLNTKEGDVNFGLFTTMVDRVLGTYYYDSQREISIADLGISSKPDFPTNYISQLVYPFKHEQKSSFD